MKSHLGPGETRTLHQARRTQTVVDQVLVQLDDEAPDAEYAEHLLRRAIAHEGLPEQPPAWVRATAQELASGHRVVIDLRTSS